jgi:two-component system response regulator NreC
MCVLLKYVNGITSQQKQEGLMTSFQVKTEPRMCRLLIADDHAIMRDGLSALLGSEDNLTVVGTAPDGETAIEAAGVLLPDVILMDLSMPGTGGIGAVRFLKRKHPDIGIVVLTFHKEEHFVRGALDAGADGYVLKDESRTELVAAINSVFGGQYFLSPGISDRVLAGFLQNGRSEGRIGTSWDRLTPREREVLKLIAEGFRTREIAVHLSLSPKTIEKHRANLMRKLELHNASAVTAYAISNQIITG